MRQTAIGLVVGLALGVGAMFGIGALSGEDSDTPRPGLKADDVTMLARAKMRGEASERRNVTAVECIPPEWRENGLWLVSCRADWELKEGISTTISEPRDGSYAILWLVDDATAHFIDY